MSLQNKVQLITYPDSLGGNLLTLHYVLRKEGDNTIAVKVTTIPKGTRSRCWFGHSDLHDYTIQADIKGAISDEKTPDIGLIAQGYALDLQGANQKLQLRSWVPQLRMAQTVDFAWQPNKWYTGEEKPAEPDNEATDESPNVAGSPGLWGNAKDAEIYIDNIKVLPN